MNLQLVRLHIKRTDWILSRLVGKERRERAKSWSIVELMNKGTRALPNFVGMKERWAASKLNSAHCYGAILNCCTLKERLLVKIICFILSEPEAKHEFVIRDKPGFNWNKHHCYQESVVLVKLNWLGICEQKAASKWEAKRSPQMILLDHLTDLGF